MTIHKIENVFLDEEVKLINSLIRKNDLEKINNEYMNRDNHPYGYGVDNQLGRLQYGIEMTKELSDIVQTLTQRINNLFNLKLSSSGLSCVEYSAEFGEPNLPVHWDHDSSEIIFNYQLSSTTSWDIGIDKSVYSMEDNSALVFNPNKYTHWRPHKKFKENEYVQMIFFRFTDLDNPSDYSHLDYSLGDPIFDDIKAFRDSLGTA